MFIENFNLRDYNTFHIDAKAHYFVEITSVAELLELLDSEIFKTQPRFILGE